jgi:tripartite ATP-independent transporter DctM subunit
VVLQRVLDRHAPAVQQVLRESLSLAFLVLIILSSVEAWPAVSAQKSIALHWSLAVPFAALPVAAAIMTVHWIAGAAQTLSVRRLASSLVIAAAVCIPVQLPLWHYLELDPGFRYVIVAACFIVPLVVGVPVAFTLGLVGFAFVGTAAPLELVTASQSIYSGIESITYLAIPLMILGGGLLFELGIARKLVDFAQVFTGRVRGGLAAADVLASAVFSDVSGSAVSDTAAIGHMIIPEMRRRGYDPAFAAAVQASAGTLGLMVPPAITLIIYATTFSLSVTTLFAAAIVPAILVSALFIGTALVISHRRHYARESVPLREVPSRAAGAVPALVGGLIVLGGILGGVFTPAEAGAVLVAYTLLLYCSSRPLRLERIGPAGLARAVVGAGHTSGMVLFLTATSTFVGFALARDLVPSQLIDAVTGLTTNEYVVLLLVNVLFILFSVVLEAPAIIVGFVPSVIPLLASVGVDPIHFAVIFVINAALGMMHPPIGLTFFVARDIADVPVMTMFKEIVPFMAASTAALVVVCALPDLALALPRLLYGYGG